MNVCILKYSRCNRKRKKGVECDDLYICLKGGREGRTINSGSTGGVTLLTAYPDIVFTIHRNSTDPTPHSFIRLVLPTYRI